MGFSVGGRFGHIGTRSSGVRAGPFSLSTGYGHKRRPKKGDGLGPEDVEAVAALGRGCLTVLMAPTNALRWTAGAILRLAWWLVAHLALVLWFLVAAPFRAIGWALHRGKAQNPQPIWAAPDPAQRREEPAA